MDKVTFLSLLEQYEAMKIEIKKLEKRLDKFNK